MLIEDERSGAATHNTAMSTGWTLAGVTQTVSATADPTGGGGGFAIFETSVSSHTMTRAPLNPTGGALNMPWAYSIFAKANGRQDVRIRMFGSADPGTWHGGVFNLSAITVATEATASMSGGLADVREAEISALSNGWFRLYIRGTPNAALTTNGVQVEFTLLNAAGAADYTGNATRGMFFYGDQLEHNQHVPTNFIGLQGATPLTRTRDVTSFTASVMSTTQGTVLFDVPRAARPQATLFDCTNGTANSTGLRVDYTAEGRLRVHVGNQFVNSTAIAHSAMRVAVGWNSSRVTLWSGNSAATVIGEIDASVEGVNLGASACVGHLMNSSFYLNGHLRRVEFFGNKRSTAQVSTWMAAR